MNQFILSFMESASYDNDGRIVPGTSKWKPIIYRYADDAVSLGESVNSLSRNLSFQIRQSPGATYRITLNGVVISAWNGHALFTEAWQSKEVE